MTEDITSFLKLLPNPGNIQQPTSNAQHPLIARLAAIGCSMLDVGCWMFSSFGSGVLLFTALTCTAADTKPLWQIGVKDGNNAEFALAPKGYNHFDEDGFFVVGQSDAKTTWPYVHPGPIDAWAGSRQHTFTILFGVDSAVSQGTCRLVLDVIDAYQRHPPTLRIEVNGEAFERSLPRVRAMPRSSATRQPASPARSRSSFPPPCSARATTRSTSPALPELGFSMTRLRSKRPPRSRPLPSGK
jgi:hypothetical protein